MSEFWQDADERIGQLDREQRPVDSLVTAHYLLAQQVRQLAELLERSGPRPSPFDLRDADATDFRQVLVSIAAVAKRAARDRNLETKAAAAEQDIPF